MFRWRSRRKRTPEQLIEDSYKADEPLPDQEETSAAADGGIAPTTTSEVAAEDAPDAIDAIDPEEEEDEEEQDEEERDQDIAVETTLDHAVDGSNIAEDSECTAVTTNETTLACESIWSTGEAEIGITNVVAVEDQDAITVCYELTLRFPAVHTMWCIKRTYVEFAALDADLAAQFKRPLKARKVYLPRPPRMSWESFRSTGLDEAGQKLMIKLNAYVHKLLEIEEVHTSTVFRAFVTPREQSSDTQHTGKLLPALSMTRISPQLSKVYTIKTKLPDVTTTSPRATTAPVAPLCDQSIMYGAAIQLRALGGFKVGLTKRSALSGSQTAVAVAAGVAGVALAGPLSAAVLALGALGGGVGKYQLNKTYYLTVTKPKAQSQSSKLRSKVSKNHHGGATHSSFLIANAEMFSGPRRSVQFGDLLHFFCKSVRKSVRIAQPPDSKRGHLMVTNQESKTAMLRLVSPYGYTGAVVCGSQVYIQVLNGQWAGQYLGLHNEFLSSGNSPTIFKLCVQDHACHASEQVMQITRPLPLAAFRLRVMVYNVWLMPAILTQLNEKLSPSTNQRAAAIPLCIAPLDVDIVVFCEAFCSTAREILIKGMKQQGFLYETKVVGKMSMSSKKAIEGGCFAMSRYPIEHFHEIPFSMAVGDDKYSDKGVIYFQTRVRDAAVVHVFGTHLQAWDTPIAIATRKAQLHVMRSFIDSMKISPHDTIVVAGDLNVNKCGREVNEYNEMLDVLQATEPPLLDNSSAFSFDPLTNLLAVDGPSSSGETERLDYVLVTKESRQPVSCSTEIVQLKATRAWQVPRGVHGEEQVDLSDHYPVVGEFQFAIQAS